MLPCCRASHCSYRGIVSDVGMVDSGFLPGGDLSARHGQPAILRTTPNPLRPPRRSAPSCAPDLRTYATLDWHYICYSFLFVSLTHRGASDTLLSSRGTIFLHRWRFRRVIPGARSVFATARDKENGQTAAWPKKSFLLAHKIFPSGTTNWSSRRSLLITHRSAAA